MAAAVIDVLRRFLPAFLRGKPALGKAQRRAVWAINHCRTAAMGGHLHACKCGTREFAYHSCNHRACPQCGKAATAEWVERELGKRVGAPSILRSQSHVDTVTRSNLSPDHLPNLLLAVPPNPLEMIPDPPDA